MDWMKTWERHRVRISQAGGLLLLILAHPRSQWLYLTGLLVAAVGELLRFWAAGHIRKGQELAREGPYAMVRNPLYLGSLVMSCGFALMCTSRTRWGSSLFVWAAVLATFRWLYAVKIRLEEEDLAGRFGPEFDSYRRSTPAMRPTVRGLARAWRSSAFSFAQALRNKEHRNALAALGLAALLRIKLAYRL